MATIEVNYGGDDVVHAQTAVHINTTGLEANTSDGYDPDNYPASPEVTYYLEATLSGQDALRSQVAAPNGGSIEWEGGLVFPAAGTWDIAARLVEDDSSAAATTLEVI